MDNRVQIEILKGYYWTQPIFGWRVWDFSIEDGVEVKEMVAERKPDYDSDKKLSRDGALEGAKDFLSNGRDFSKIY